MSEPVIHVFHHRAMATYFQIRIADEERGYAAQAAQEGIARVDELEAKLTRFRVTSEISRLARLAPGETLRLTEPVFACLQIAQQMELATGGAFSITAAALQTQAEKPQWTLLDNSFSLRCESGRLEFDLGAIGKGFALDCVAEMLREWGCPAFLLIAGGSSILAGNAPAGLTGWSCGLGEDNSQRRHWLTNVSLSGSGLAVKGAHILNPRTGQAETRRPRVWALAPSAAESDALSTAGMVLDEPGLLDITLRHPDWLVLLGEEDNWRCLGRRAPPPLAS